MALLIVEQGTILDRIDYNLEQTQSHVSQAVENFVDAEKSQRKARTKMCMILMIALVVVMVFVLTVKLLWPWFTSPPIPVPLPSALARRFIQYPD